MMNSDFVQSKITAPGGRVESLFALMPADQAVSNIYYSTLSRPPSKEELVTLTTMIHERPSGEARRRVLQDLMWTLLNSREFLFNH